MKEIYWIINQLNNTDEVLSAIETANILVQYRSISLIVLGKNYPSLLWLHSIFHNH